MDDVKFVLLRLAIKDMLTEATYMESLNIYDDIASGKVEALQEVLELLEEDRWK